MWSVFANILCVLGMIYSAVGWYYILKVYQINFIDLLFKRCIYYLSFVFFFLFINRVKKKKKHVNIYCDRGLFYFPCQFHQFSLHMLWGHDIAAYKFRTAMSSSWIRFLYVWYIQMILVISIMIITLKPTFADDNIKQHQLSFV